MAGVKDGAADCDRGRGSTGRSGDVAGDWLGLAALLASFKSLIGIVAVSMRDVKRRDGCGVTNIESLPLPPPGWTVTDMATAATAVWLSTAIAASSASRLTPWWHDQWSSDRLTLDNVDEAFVCVTALRWPCWTDR